MNLAHHLLRAAGADASAPALLSGLTPVADYGRRRGDGGLAGRFESSARLTPMD